MDPLRPSVSRETRLLLTIVLISLGMLWVLARIRFPGRAATPNPVPPVLAQLAPPSAFEDMTSTVARLAPHVEHVVTAIVLSNDGGSGSSPVPAQALRFRDDLAIALTSERDAARTVDGAPIEMTARDPATGLSLLRVGGDESAAPEIWSSRGMQNPRFLIASDAATGGVSLRPVFIGSLTSIASPRWAGSLWAVPYGVDLRAGTFLFTVDGELAGLAIRHDDHTAIVPGELLVTSVDRLTHQPTQKTVSLGAEVQGLTPTLVTALEARSGVVVTWVDPAGPAAGILSPLDVVERVNGVGVTSPDQWESQMLGLSDGGTAVLDVRRQGEPDQIRLIARAKMASTDDPVLGLTFRTVPKVGAEVVQVLPRSAGGRAGIRVGDIITTAGDVENPSAAQIPRLFATASKGGSLVVALTRDQDHRVVAIRKVP
jgi:hypothetical protein